jgi:hypothetical protein
MSKIKHIIGTERTKKKQKAVFSILFGTGVYAVIHPKTYITGKIKD